MRVAKRSLFLFIGLLLSAGLSAQRLSGQIPDTSDEKLQASYKSVYKRGELKRTYLYSLRELDDNGNVTALYEYNRKSKLIAGNIYLRDDNGRIRTWIHIGKNKEIKYKTTYAYDQEGNKTEHVSYRARLDRPDWRYVYAYNENGQISEKKLLAQVEEDNLRWLYEYREDGTLKSVTQYDHEGNVVAGTVLEGKD